MNKKTPGYVYFFLGGDYITQLCGDYNKPLIFSFFLFDFMISFMVKQIQIFWILPFLVWWFHQCLHFVGLGCWLVVWEVLPEFPN